MQALRKLQTQFVRALQDPKALGSFEKCCVKNPRNFQAGFTVYHNNVQQTAIKVLKNTYPVSEKLLGKTVFERISLEYLALTPSLSFSLNEYGDKFPDFLLKVSDHFSDNAFPFLNELAALEWRIHCALTGPAHKTFDFEAFSKVPEAEKGKIIFHLAQNGFLLSSCYSIDNIWEKTYHSPEIFLEENELLPQEEPLYFWVQSKEYLLSIRRLSAARVELIHSLLQSLSLEEIVTQFSLRSDLESTGLINSVQSLILGAIASGLITHFSF